MSNKVLITGGAGFIGSHTADLLLKRGFKVTIIDSLVSKNHSDGWPSYLDKRVIKIKGDVRNKKQLLAALQGIDYVIHLAAWMDMGPEFSHFFSSNAVGTSNIYELIVRHKLPIKKVIIGSSQFIYGQGKGVCQTHGTISLPDRLEQNLIAKKWDLTCPKCHRPVTPMAHVETNHDPSNQYSISKYTQELIALKLGRNFNIPSVVLRYSIVHGPRQSLKNSYSGALRQFYLWLSQGNEVTVYEDGLQLRDFVSVYDVASANLCALTNPKAVYEAYNVGGGRKYTVIQLAKMVAKSLNKKVIINTPGLYRVGDTRHSFSNIKKLKALGWKPKKTAQENIDEFVAWAKKQETANISVDKIQTKLSRLGMLRQASH